MRKLNKLSADHRARVATGHLPERNPSNRVSVPYPRDWRIALIDGSADAIVSRNLNGIIQSWNDAATRLYGYSAEEAIGKSIAILLPKRDLAILAQIRRGKRTGHFETKGRRKDGSLVDISLTISVIRNEDGVIVGVSEIARDITDSLMAQEQQWLLMSEMRHRMKNLFALAGAIVSISAGSSGSGKVINDIRARLSSLARAHDMTMAGRPYDGGTGQAASLLRLIHRILDPYAAGNGRVAIAGHDCDVGAKAIPYVSLLLHELATNAAKFGSLSVGSGRLDVSVATDGDLVRLLWRETGGPAPSTGGPQGFGSRLERSVTRALHMTIERDWRLTGLVATAAIPKAVLCR